MALTGTMPVPTLPCARSGCCGRSGVGFLPLADLGGGSACQARACPGAAPHFAFACIGGAGAGSFGTAASSPGGGPGALGGSSTATAFGTGGSAGSRPPPCRKDSYASHQAWSLSSHPWPHLCQVQWPSSDIAGTLDGGLGQERSTTEPRSGRRLAWKSATAGPHQQLAAGHDLAQRHVRQKPFSHPPPN